MNPKNLAYLSLTALLACGNTGDVSKNKIWCLDELNDDKVIEQRVDNLTANPHILAASDFCELPYDLRSLTWDKLREAEQTGLAPDVPEPESFQDLEDGQEVISVTRDEAFQIYSAHLASSLWMDNFLPWKLADYNEEEIKDLHKPQTYFATWNLQASNFKFKYVIDHSPAETLSLVEIALNIDNLSTQNAAMVDFVKYLRLFRHGVLPDDPREINTMFGMHNEKISRRGCQSLAPYFVKLAAAINIPGKTAKGWYYGKGHRSAFFPFVGKVLPHGDNVYNSLLNNVPSSELMDDYDFWEDNVLAYEKGDPLGAHNSLVQTMNKTREFPSYVLSFKFCKKGRPYLDETFIGTELGDFATPQQLDDLEIRLLDLTNDCTEYITDSLAP